MGIAASIHDAFVSLLALTIGFIGKLSWQDSWLILFIALLLFRARKLPQMLKEMEQLLREMGEAVREIIVARRALERCEPTEEQKRILRRCDVIAAAVFLFMIALSVAATLQNS
jgi:Sec-independent protein translocase protein TatA